MINEDSKLKEKLDRKNREIQILKESSSIINSSVGLDINLHSLLKSLDEYFLFKHSMILLTDADGKFLTVFASYGYSEAGIGSKVRIGKGIIGTVAKRKKMLNMGNITYGLMYMSPGKDISEHPEYEIIIKLPGLANPKSQVAFPLVVQDELVGVISVESEKINIFRQEDEEIISVIAEQAAMAIQKSMFFEAEAKRHKEIHEINDRLSNLLSEQQKTLSLFVKYVPEPIVKKALREKPESIFEGELMEITVLFCDIRDFTGTSEKLTPNEVVFLLNVYYSKMTKVIRNNDGVVHQFVGDEIFATFGAPVSVTNSQEKAVYCAFDMLNELEEINMELKKSLNVEIKVGIGINYGPAVVGNLGSKDRIVYSVTGDTVNTGKRIETLTRSCPNTILISDSVYQHTTHLINTKAWDPISVKGKSEKVLVYEVLGLSA